MTSKMLMIISIHFLPQNCCCRSSTQVQDWLRFPQQGALFPLPVHRRSAAKKYRKCKLQHRSISTFQRQKKGRKRKISPFQAPCEHPADREEFPLGGTDRRKMCPEQTWMVTLSTSILENSQWQPAIGQCRLPLFQNANPKSNGAGIARPGSRCRCHRRQTTNDYRRVQTVGRSEAAGSTGKQRC